MTTFNTTVTTDKQTYTKGDLITATLNGDATTNATTSNTTLTVNLQAADGGTGSATVTVPITTPGVSENVVITSVSDTLNHTWTVATGGKTATTTA